jgi:hypothetical protein
MRMASRFFYMHIFRMLLFYRMAADRKALRRQHVSASFDSIRTCRCRMRQR